MAMEVKHWRCGGSDPLPLSLRRSLNPSPCRLSFRNTQVTQTSSRLANRFVTLAVVKRSPKRLKYSAPRFTKDDGLVYVEVDPCGSDAWKLDPILELLRQGAVGVIPTDTVTLQRQPLSILCRSFKDIDTYTTGFPRGNDHGLTNIFRAVKHCLPGPYTFILTASKELPKQCTRYGTAASKYAMRKNVGVHMPDDAVCQAILEKFEAPLISTSVKSPKENEWILDPVMIADVYGPEGLDFVVDAGIRVADPSTVVDMTGNYPKVVRQGKGPKQPWMVAEDEDTSVEDSNLLSDRPS